MTPALKKSRAGLRTRLVKSIWRGLRFYEITCRERRLGSFVASSNKRRAVKIWRREHPELKRAKLTVERVERKK